MWLTYLDESGNTGRRLDDPDQPCHVIAGVSVREDMVGRVASHIDDVVASRLHTRARTKRTELHGIELRRGSGPWSEMSPAERISVLRESLEPLRWDGVMVSYAAVNKPGLADRGDRRAPHLWALQFLIEKLNSYFRSQGEHTLLVADETNEHEQFALDLLLDLQAGNPERGLNFGAMDRIVDTVHFVRSETNRGVQLADLVSYLRCRLFKDGSNNAVEQKIWDELVRPSVRTYRSLWP